MKFAEIRYIKDGEPLWVSDFILKLPQWLRLRYFLCCVPLKIEEMSLSKEKGVRVTLPIKANEKNHDLYTRMLRKTISFLMEKEIKVVINRDTIPLPSNFLQARGSLSIAYFIPKLVESACLDYEIDLSKANIVVIDGKNIETFIVLNRLMGEVNHLSIRTDNRESLEDLADKIYEETGLVTEFFVSPKGSAMKDADIIINCNDDMENFDYVFKKGAVYIEASSFKGKIHRLMARRTDMKFLTDVLLNSEEGPLDSMEAEVLFLLSCSELETGLKNNCSSRKKQEIYDIMEALNFGLSFIKS